MSNLLKMMAGAGIAAPLYVNDVFSAYTYTGNGSTQTITNGIDLAGEGGMVWIKVRNNAGFNHELCDTARGITNWLYANATNAQGGSSDVTAVSATGFSLAHNTGNGNQSGNTQVSWTFRNSDRFFNHASVVKSAGSNATVSFTGLGTIGMVAVKRTDVAGSWYVWHRSLTAGKLLYLEQDAAEATLGHITVSGTTVTLVDAVITDGTYIVYAWAHDTEADGIIQCGSFTTDGSGNATVNLGWEPQYVMFKVSSATGGWGVQDSMRGLTTKGSNQALLLANMSIAELSGPDWIGSDSTGFVSIGNGATQTYIYLAIRRPNKPPTVGTQVYNAIARTGTGAAATVTGVGFAPDLVQTMDRTNSFNWSQQDRLRGAGGMLRSDITAVEATYSTSVTSFNMDGVTLGIGGSGGGSYYNVNESGYTYINHFFRRAPGFFDSSCDTGTGANKTESHNLGVAPELVIRKGRSGATQWEVWCASIANTEKLVLNSTAAKATDTTAWNSTSPTASVFTVGTGANVNTNTATYVTYLFATLAGISKVGSYTGTAATLQINCGFTTGARFVLIKRTDSAGDWYVWDTVRGIIAGNDPYLLLNSTAAEVTTTDYIDPYSSGFEISSTAPAAINASGGTYIYLAIA